MKILYKPSFIRQYKKLIPELQEEVKDTIELLGIDPDTPKLKSHKLKGKLQGCWSCSINFSYRIVFEYESSQSIVLLKVGNHDVYR